MPHHLVDSWCMSEQFLWLFVHPHSSKQQLNVTEFMTLNTEWTVAGFITLNTKWTVAGFIKLNTEWATCKTSMVLKLFSFYSSPFASVSVSLSKFSCFVFFNYWKLILPYQSKILLLIIASASFCNLVVCTLFNVFFFFNWLFSHRHHFNKNVIFVCGQNWKLIQLFKDWE